MKDHDTCLDDPDRIQESEHRTPRVVVVSECSDGILAWGELSKGDCGYVMDTTLTGHVLNPIEREVRSGKNGGSVLVDGIEYVYCVSRR